MFSTEKLEGNFRNAASILTTIGRAATSIYRINPFLTTSVIGLTLISALFPMTLALITRYLFNDITAVIQGDTGREQRVIILIGASLSITIISNLLVALNKYTSSRLQNEISLNITSGILSHCNQMDTLFFEDIRNHDLIDRVEKNTASRLFQLFSGSFQALSTLIKIISLLAILVVIEPLVLLATVPFIAAYSFFNAKISRWRYQEHYNRTTMNRRARYAIRLSTHNHFLHEVRIFNLTEYLYNQTRKILKEFAVRDKQIHARIFTNSTGFITLLYGAYFICFFRTITRAMAGSLTIGDVVIFGGISANIHATFERAIQTVTNVYENALHVAEYQDFLNISPAREKEMKAEPEKVHGEIEFENVTFYYPDSNHPVLKNVSFHVRPGDIIAVVGENGSGKTTLAKVLCGSYRPQSGVVKIDGIPVEKWSRKGLNQHISAVFQNYCRFEATAAENIAFGDWQKILNDSAKIEQIAKEANVHEMIEKMPEGYASRLGKFFGTHDPSGGQWQSLAIARAFARNAPILILDEPTSNLDIKREFALLEFFKKMSSKRTTIFISHRFTTVRLADLVLVLDDGRLVEKGNHEDLMSLDGFYAKLYKLKMSLLS